MADLEPIYVSATVIAKIIGKTANRVYQLTQDGTLPTELNPKTGKGSYELVGTLKRYIAFLDEKAHGQKQKAERLSLEDQKLKAEVALKESQADLHKLKTDIANGKYVPVEEVELDYQKFFVIFKKFATGIPSRLAGTMSTYLEPVVVRGIEKDLTNEITEMLQSFVVSAKEREGADE
jgi:phage terminase Nu1 subunit (DNA packaging protein)